MSTKQNCQKLADSMQISVEQLPRGYVHISADLKVFKKKYKRDWHEFHKTGNIQFSWESAHEELLDIKQRLKGKTMEVVEVKVQQVKSGSTRGRRSGYAGKKLVAKTQDNNRRKNTHGYTSLQIIIDNSPISYEMFISKGGRLQDLAWDIKKGNVEVN